MGIMELPNFIDNFINIARLKELSVIETNLVIFMTYINKPYLFTSSSPDINMDIFIEIFTLL
jgi:hypothetical protein